MAIISLLLLLLFSTAANAFESPRQCPTLPPELDKVVERTFNSKQGDLFVVLKNGLTVLIRQDLNSDVVSAQVFVRAGSIYEGERLTSGLSHYLEHIVSSGSTHSFTEAQAKERLQRMGGNTNAYTTYDRTAYYINTSAPHWQDALDLLLSYVSENKLDPQEVAREKPIIQQEIKMGENNSSRELWKLFVKTAYKIHPVKDPVIGYEDVFVHLDRDALKDYYEEQYRPENIVVSVAGNIAPDEVLEFIAGKTKDFVRGPRKGNLLPDEPPQISQRWEEKEVPIAKLTSAMIGFPSVTFHSRDVYALDVLALLLGQGETCRLNCRLRDKENQVLSIGASNWTPGFVRGQFIISLTLPPENWPGALTSIEDEIESFKRDLVAPEELEKAKKAVIARSIFGRETASSQASSLASSYMETGDPYFDEKYVDEIRKVTPEQVRDVAQRYLMMDRMSVAVTKPPRDEITPVSATVKAKGNSVVSSPEFHRLENGLRLLVKSDSSLPVVNIHLYGPGGLYMESIDRPGLSAFTASLLTSGTKERSKLEIYNAIERVGGSISARSDNNTYHVTARVLKEDLDLAIDMLSDILQNAEFPAEEIEKTRKETLLAIQKRDESWQAEVSRLFKKAYFNKSSYINDHLGTAESVNSFSREDVQAFYRRMVNPNHSVLAIYGDIDPAQVLTKVRQGLGTWKGEKIALTEGPDETRQLSADRRVERSSNKSSPALFVGTNGLSLGSQERPVLDVLDSVLLGSGTGSRLFEALRGSQDLVYVVGGSPFYGRRAGYFGILTQTTQANLDKVEGIIMEHLERLAEEPVPADELQRAKDALITSYQIGRESLNNQAQQAALNEALGMGWDYDRRYLEQVRSVTAEDVQRLARDLFRNKLVARTLPENPVEILASPPADSKVATP